MLQLHVLKLIKSQVPFCGRKWRQCEMIRGSDVLSDLIPFSANMQVITAIYLNCRPDLRDEWLTGIEVDDVVDAQVRFLSLLFRSDGVLRMYDGRHKNKPYVI